MRIMFMGTPEFAAACLRKVIAAGLPPVGVVTQPDRPKGRGMVQHPSEVKIVALKNQLPLWQPESISDPEFLKPYQLLQPDLVVVVAFGQKIPDEILFGPRFGCINVHGSLLPKYRGAAPIQWSIINGDAETGVTTMYMDEGWDTGDIIYQEKTAVDPDENFGVLYSRLAQLGAELLIKTLQDIENGKAPRIPQNHSLATKAPKLKDELQKINWNDSAVRIHNLVRVFAPAPGMETILNGERLKIIETFRDDGAESQTGKPGEILGIIKNKGILTAVSENTAIILSKVQPLGKRVMSGVEFSNGRRLHPGMYFSNYV